MNLVLGLQQRSRLISNLMNFFEGLSNSLTQTCPKTAILIKLIGFVVLLKKIFNILRTIYKMTLRKRLNFKKRYGQNTWAFITGSSQGIGKAFAFELAREGFNIILCARTLSKLQKVKQQILLNYPSIRVEILVIDFKRVLQQQYLHSQLQQIQNLEVSILVNNVGVDVLDFYTDLTETQITDLIKINCFPVAILNRYFIPLFNKRLTEKKKKSAIINVASLAGEIPMPLHNVYSAAKAYVDYLSRALSYEYPKIDIISLRPSEVSTPMTFNKQTDVLTILPQDCVKGLLNDLGYQYVSNGYWTHQLQGWLYSVLPQKLFNFVWLNYIGPDFINERRRVQVQNKKMKEN